MADMVSREYAQMRMNALKEFDDTIIQSLEKDREHLYAAQRTAVALRRLLRDYDPSLPDEFDGNAWAPIEKNLRESVWGAE